MIEVLHNISHALAFFSNQVLDWNFHVVKLDIGGASSDLALHLQSSHIDAQLALKRYD
jgi:hypothetical protein